jgi:Domain of unknown function (DUF4136)
MRTYFSALLLLVAILGVWGCMGPKVRTDFDPAADFTTFRTYAFAGLTDLNQGGVLNNSLIRKRLEQVVGEQLSSKGLRQVDLDEHPDLQVHYWVTIKEKQRVQSTGPMVGPYGRRGYGEVTTYDYEEGTLIIDLVTPSKNELVWRGSIVSTLADSKEGNIEMVNRAIAKAFEDYPPTRKNP